MVKKFSLSAKKRTDAPNQIRSNGDVPAVLYGHGVKPQNLQVSAKELDKVYSNTGSTSLVTIQVDGEGEHPVLIRELQHHPLTSNIIHVDLYQVRMDEKIRTDVPLHFVGESSAVKDKSGVFVRSMDEIDLAAFPQDLPHDIEVDISVLNDFDQAIHVSDLKLPEGVEVFNDPDAVIALVQPPKSEEELEAELTQEVSEDVESVEGVKDAEEVPGEGAEEGQESAEKPEAE